MLFWHFRNGGTENNHEKLQHSQCQTEIRTRTLPNRIQQLYGLSHVACHSENSYYLEDGGTVLPQNINTNLPGNAMS